MGFLEVVGDPPRNKNPESYGLPSPSPDFSWSKLGPGVKPANAGKFGHMKYRSVLKIAIYDIITIPKVLIYSVWTGPVRDVLRLFI